MADVLERLKAALADRYCIDRELGSGGMATVYLAQDLKHDRRVAVKVLRPELAAVLGAERFLNEIKVTANLQHPHVLPLHDLSGADSFLYYVMPYVEGESLRDKLNREKQLPIEESIEITKAVASALDYAHRHNVIHRDIKPENILIHEGQPVVADFGIALAVSAAAGARLTETGLSLGTPQYMSPEQATGDRELDGRSDIYSLACVLYEMLSGEPPHTGPTVQAVIARVVTDRPRPLTELRETVPAHVGAAVHKALAKLPADRFVTAGDFGTAVADPAAAASLRVLVGDVSSEDQARRSRIRLGLGVLGWVTALIAVALVLRPERPGESLDSRVRRLNVLLPDSLPVLFTSGGVGFANGFSVAVSPDGSTIAYVTEQGGTSALAVRRMDDTVVTVLPGTEGAWGQIVFSPDGQSIAFYVRHELKKVAVSGGPVVALAELVSPYGACWGPDDQILVATTEGLTKHWVSASSGNTEPAPAPTGERLILPDLLPDSQTALVTWDQHALAILSLDDGALFALTLDGPLPYHGVDESRLLFGRQAKYVPSGHIVYVRWDGVLMALPFDVDNLQVLGEPMAVLHGVKMEAQTGIGQFQFSREGTLVYVPGENHALGQLAWVDRAGTVDFLPLEPRVYGGFDLSHDAERIGAQVLAAGGPPEIWSFDLGRNMSDKVPTQGNVFPPIWWRDSETLVYSEFHWGSSARSVIRQRFTTTWDRDTLPVEGWVQDVSPDGSLLAVSYDLSEPGLRLVPASGAGDVVVIDPHPHAWGPVFSPDGRWLAYNSDRSGRIEVYVVRIPFDSWVQKVSTDGGGEPIWNPAGNELIYRQGRRLMAVDAPAPGSFEFGSPRLLFEGTLLDVQGRGHDISPDGQRLLVVLGSADETVGHFNVITNWFAELERLAPPTRN